MSFIRSILIIFIWVGTIWGTYSAAKHFTESLRRTDAYRRPSIMGVFVISVICVVVVALIGWLFWIGFPFDKYDEYGHRFSLVSSIATHYLAAKIFLVLLISASVGIYRAFRLPPPT